MTYVLDNSDEAREHVARIEHRYGRNSHSLTACPPWSRAMCHYARVPQDPQAVEREREVREAFKRQTDELRAEGFIPPPD